MKRNSKCDQSPLLLLADSRRDTMRRLAAGAVASGLGLRAHAQEAASAPLAIEPWTLTPGAPLLSPPYGVPSSFESDRPEDTRLDAQSLPNVKMPNREGFVADPRPGQL